MTWNPELYLRFAGERTRPCIDLAARLAVAEPETIVDLGCGPGNSTAVLRSRYPQARIIGVDSSPEMLERARASGVQAEWQPGDLRTWRSQQPCDVIFSNAALHWVSDHQTVLPRLLKQLPPGGQLAIQLPAQQPTRAHRCLYELAGKPRWRDQLAGALAARTALSLHHYYDLLAPGCERVELWQTDYHHVMERAGDIVAWLRSTGLRPFLAALSDHEQDQLLAELTDAVRASYPPSASGKVLYPFRRLLMVATRPPR